MPQASVDPGLPAVNTGMNPPVAAQPAGVNSPEDYVLLMEMNRIRNEAMANVEPMPPLPMLPGAEEARAAILSVGQDQSAQAATPTAAPVMPRPPGGAQQFPPQAPQ